MPGVAIEQDVRTMLSSWTALTSAIPAVRMSHGYRLQDGSLPALTYELPNVTQESIGGSPTIRLATVEITIIAATTKAALDIVPYVRAACREGTYGITDFDAVIWRGYTTSASTVGEGDEQEPAEVTANIDIYYRE